VKLLVPLPPHRQLNIKDNNNPKLMVLTLDVCKLDDTDMLTISLALAKNCSLTALRLPRNAITNIGVTYFCQHWRKDSPIRELNLYHNHIGATGAVLLLQTVAQRPAMKDLLIAGNTLIGHAGLQLLAAQIPFLGIRVLDMSACVFPPEFVTQYSRESTDAARALANGLRGNTSLKELCIGANNLGPLGIKLIMQAVAAHPTLSQLWIAFDPSIGLKGLKHIGKLLPNTRLNCLYMDDAVTPWPRIPTKLVTEAGQSLLRGVQNCPHMRLFAYNALAPMWMEPIQLLVDLNKTCRPMLFSSESITSALWPHVLAHYGNSQGKNNHLYFCLREQPWLMVASSR
jgi:hypothetical protein